MTKQATATATPKATTFYGITAKDFLTIVQAENNAQRLGDMLAFVRKRISEHAVKHPTRVKRWERVSDAIIAKLNGTPAQASAPVLANAVTFTQAPLPKAAKATKATKAKKPKAQADSVEARLARMEALVNRMAEQILA